MILETLRIIICHSIIITQAPRVKSVGKERFSRTEYWQHRKDRRGQDAGEIKGVIEPWLERPQCSKGLSLILVMCCVKRSGDAVRTRHSHPDKLRDGGRELGHVTPGILHPRKPAAGTRAAKQNPNQGRLWVSRDSD